MKTNLIITALLLISSIYGYSSEEGYFGKYCSNNSGIKVEFTLNEEGVSNLFIDSVKIDMKTMTYDYLAIFGNSQIFQINFVDNKNCNNIIKLFIVKNEGEFIIISGYYMQFTIDEFEKITVIRKQALELSCKRL